MALSLQTFATWTNAFAAQVQASATALVDFSVGSLLRAVAEANASIALWFQWLLLQLLALTRAATSNGADLDTWMADFGFVRLGAGYATGLVTLSRFTPSIQAVIPVGTLVRTGDGTQTFTIVADTTNPAWNAALAGFVVPINTASVTVAVQAVTIGLAGNVQAGAISQLLSAISGIDLVTNAAALTNGIGPESDARFRSRFVLWINSRSLGVAAAIQAAVLGVQQNLVCTIQENVDTTGAFKAANFVVTVDDGTGSPSDAEIAAVMAAVEAVRGLAITYSIQKPILLTADISLAILANSTVLHATVAAQVAAAVTNYVAALPIGAPLAWSRIAQVAYDANPNIVNVFGVTLNLGTADLVPTPAGVVRLGTLAVI